MSTNLVSLALQYLTPDLIAKMASALGVDRSMIGKTVSAALPALIGVFASSATRPGGAAKLDTMVANQDPDILDNLSSMFSGGGQSEFISAGMNALKSILGPSNTNSLSDALGRFSGLGAGKATSLLGMLTPAVLGLLSQQKKDSGLDANGLAQLLAAQRDNVAAAMPSGFGDILGQSDVPGFETAAAVNDARRPIDSARTKPAATASTGSYRLAPRSSAGLWTWILPLAALAAIGWWLVSERMAPAPNTVETTTASAANPADLSVNGVNLRQTWIDTYTKLRSTLEAVNDTNAVQSAMPELESAGNELQRLAELSQQLTADGQAALASLVREGQPTIDKLLTQVEAMPDAAEPAKSVVGNVREQYRKLANLSQPAATGKNPG